MAKKRRVARQKYMDRIKELDQERRAHIKKRQELGELKRLRKRQEIEVAKRNRNEDDNTTIAQMDQEDDAAAATSNTSNNQQVQQKNAAITQDRSRLKKIFGGADTKRDRDGAAVAGSSATSASQRGGAPGKMRRVEED